VESAEMEVFVLKMPRASWFYCVFWLFSGISKFSSDLRDFRRKRTSKPML
jgi:hypothetical protein